jgi:hypothetical protein
MTIAADGSNVHEVIDRFAASGEAGFSMVTTALPEVYTLEAIGVLGERVIPVLAAVQSGASAAAH